MVSPRPGVYVRVCVCAPWSYVGIHSSLLHTEFKTETLKFHGSFYIRSFWGLVVFTQNCSYTVVLSIYVLSAQIQFYLFFAWDL